MALAAMGLTPISPVIEVFPVVEMPDFARNPKLPEEPRFTLAGPAASAIVDPVRLSMNEMATMVCID